MSNTAAKVAAEKERSPERFCSVKGCLWRIATANGVNPCRKHPAPRTIAPAASFYTTDGHYWSSTADGQQHQRTLDAKAARQAERVAAYLERVRTDPDGWATMFIEAGAFATVEEAVTAAERLLADATGREQLSYTDGARLGMAFATAWNRLHPELHEFANARAAEYERQRRARLLADTTTADAENRVA